MFSTSKLRTYLDGHGIKQKYLAEKTGIPESALSRIVSGKRKCEVNEFLAICKALGQKPEVFTEVVSK